MMIWAILNIKEESLRPSAPFPSSLFCAVRLLTDRSAGGRAKCCLLLLQWLNEAWELPVSFILSAFFFPFLFLSINKNFSCNNKREFDTL